MIELYSTPRSDAHEIAKGVVVDFGEKGNVVGIDIDHGSQKLDFKSIDVESLPIPMSKIA